MMEMFDKVFDEVMEENRLENWYELFDSDEFGEVEERVSNLLGYDCWDNEEFCKWVDDMNMDL